MKKIFHLVASSALALTLAACGGGEDEEIRTSAQVRYFNAFAFAPASQIILGVDIDDPADSFVLNFGDITNYISYDQNEFDFLSFRESSPVFDDPETVRVGDGEFATVVLIRENGIDRFLDFEDLDEEPAGGTFNIRLVNLFERTDSVDFYFINLEGSIEETDPTEGSVGFTDDSDYFNATNRTGGQRLVVTENGESQPIFDSGPITLQTERNYTLYLIPLLGGSERPNGIIVEDGNR